MKFCLKFSVILFFLCLYNSLTAQSLRVDSLKAVLNKEHLPDTLILSAINHLFEEFYYRKDSIQSDYYAELLIKEATKRGHATFRRQGQINRAFIFLEKDGERGRAIIEPILKEAIAEQDQLGIGRCYLYLGWDDFLNVHQNQDTDCNYFTDAQKLLGEMKSSKEAYAFIGLSNCIGRKNGYTNTQALIDFLTAGFETGKKYKNPVWMIKSLRRKAFYEYQLGNNKAATTSVLAAIEIAKTQNYKTHDLLDCYLTIADLAFYRSDTLRAIDYGEKALTMGKELNHDYGTSEAAYCLAYYHIRFKKDIGYAKELLDYSLEIADANNFKQSQALVYFYWGFLYEGQEQKELAKENYLKSFAISEEANIVYLNLRAQERLAALFEIGDDAKLISTDTLKLEAIESTIGKRFFTKINMHEAENKQDFENAFFWSKKFRQVEKTFHEEKMKNTIEEKLLEQELANQKKELAVNSQLIQTTNFKNRALSIAIILATLILSILYYLFYAKKRHHQKILQKNIDISTANELVDNLNRDLAKKNELLAAKNELLEKEVVDYIAFQSNRTRKLTELKLAIDKTRSNSSTNEIDWQFIRSKVDTLTINQNDWLHFKQKIENRYPNFFRALALKHPDLNKREQTHCAYILMNMNVKQVAESLFIAPKTVESARYRIKKKLGLTKSDNLLSYIKQVQN